MLPAMSFTMLATASGVAALLLLVYFLSLYRKEQKLADYHAKISLEDKSPRWIEKKAQELARVEAYRLAGDLRAHLKQWGPAAELYQKGNNFLRAAECFLQLGRPTDAAQMFMASRDYERAASLYLESGDHAAAANAFVQAGAPMKAAATYEQAGAFELAADVYVAQGLYRRAAAAFRKREQWGPAAEALWRSFGEERTRLPPDVSLGDSMPLRIIARAAGEMYQRAGRGDEAIEAFRQGGWKREAAAALAALGRHAEAADAYLELGELLPAADAYQAAGLSRQAAGLRAQHHLAAGREREAIHFLEAAAEFARAAALHQKLGNWSQAGEDFELADQFAEAAAMFEKGDELERAAAARQKAGQFKAAAELYARAGNLAAQADALEAAGDFLAAGGNYYSRGLLDKAIALLQKVEAQSPEYSAAALLLGQIFKEKGLLDLAIENFRRSIRNQEISRSRLENFYQLATCQERAGAPADAARIFEQILVIDFHFKDVADRLAAIKSAVTQVETTPTATTQSALNMEDTVAGARLLGTPMSFADQRYALLKEIGRGGMGIVYKARDNVLEREIAFKVLPANLKEHPQALKNFFREAKSAAKLNHPNIVTVYDAGETEGTYYIAMEFVAGETIKEILNREGKLPTKAVLMIAGQVCKALEFAHERKIVHRDIKSSNIMWTPDKQVKLMDFGLAKVIEEVRGYQTVASGTPYYMSPEQALGRNIDHRTDIYSLGVTIFEMTTGKLPFMQGDAAYHHVHSPQPHACAIDPAIPEPLDAIIYQCMQKRPEDRFPHAKDLFNALKRAMSA
jgi:eukaryotic-like serine/threonine-protein kinase